MTTGWANIHRLIGRLGTAGGHAEILAMLNYESRHEEALKALKLSAVPMRERSEGTAIMDVDPISDNFGKVLYDIPLPPDLVAHPIFYDKYPSKAYVTALGKSELRVMDMTRYPYRMRRAPSRPRATPSSNIRAALPFTTASIAYW